MSSRVKWINKIKGLCIDINGVLYEFGANKVIDGSIEALERLKKHSIPFYLLTNETSEDLHTFTSKLNSIGFNLSPDSIIAPAPQVALYLKENGLRPYLLTKPELHADFVGVDKSNPNCVVVGDAIEHFNFDNMNAAFRVLINDKDAPLIGMGRSKFYKWKDELVLDQGAFLTGLEFASDREALIIGKPSAKYFDLALKRLGFEANQVAMIGDDIRSDVKASQDIGMKGILVRSGKYRQEKDENDPTIKPDLIVDNLSKFVDELCGSL